ncbi:hypothetical protein [Microbacterium sp. Gd 4-13]|nr:hypothetical protein [Microbacterium sp. Gd 4-13]
MQFVDLSLARYGELVPVPLGGDPARQIDLTGEPGQDDEPSEL